MCVIPDMFIVETKWCEVLIIGYHHEAGINTRLSEPARVMYQTVGLSTMCNARLFHRRKGRSPIYKKKKELSSLKPGKQKKSKWKAFYLKIEY